MAIGDDHVVIPSRVPGVRGSFQRPNERIGLGRSALTIHCLDWIKSKPLAENAGCRLGNRKLPAHEASGASFLGRGKSSHQIPVVIWGSKEQVIALLVCSWDSSVAHPLPEQPATVRVNSCNSKAKTFSAPAAVIAREAVFRFL